MRSTAERIDAITEVALAAWRVSEQRKAALAAFEERAVRLLLERWVSEIEPATVYRGGVLIGLVPADTPMGVKPFILFREDV